MKSLFLNLLILIISLSLAIFLGELYLRIFSPQVISIGINSEWTQADSELGCVSKANVRGRMESYVNLQSIKHQFLGFARNG